MVKYLLIVLSVAAAIYFAFQCGIFEVSRNRKNNFDYPGFGRFDEAKHETPWPSYLADCFDSGDTPERDVPRNKAPVRAQEVGTLERIRSKFSFCGSPKVPATARELGSKFKPGKQEIDISPDNRFDVGDPRAASTELKIGHRRISSPELYQNDVRSHQATTVQDIEKCCKLFFGDKQKNIVNDVSRDKRDLPEARNMRNPASKGLFIKGLRTYSRQKS